MPPRPSPESFLPLSNDEALILVVLTHTVAHGYGIIQEIRARSDGEMEVLPGVLYRILRRLLSGGLIAETDAPRGEPRTDERRRYYQITDLGTKVLAAEIKRIGTIMRAAKVAQAGGRPRLA